MAQLHVRLIDAAVTGGKAYVVFTDDGEMLPNQTACTVSCGPDGKASITIELVVDGKDVCLGEPGPAADEYDVIEYNPLHGPKVTRKVRRFKL